MGKSLGLRIDKASYRAVERELKSLSEIDKNAIVRKGIQDALKVPIAAGKQSLAEKHNIVKKKGVARLLHQTFSYNTNKKKSAKGLYGVAGFKRGAGSNASVAHLIDRGTVKRWTKKGAYRGSVSKGRPKTGSYFWTNAVLESHKKETQILIDAINKAIVKIVNR